MKSYYRRGQAWVVFDTIDNAKEAVKAMQNFPFVGKPMVRGGQGGVDVACLLLNGFAFSRLRGDTCSALAPLSLFSPT